MVVGVPVPREAGGVEMPPDGAKAIAKGRGTGMMQMQKMGGGMEQFAKWLDWPPVWFAGGLVIIVILGWIGFPVGFGGYGAGLGLAFVAFGAWLMVSALMLMRGKQTTVNPRGVPSALVTEGVFGISRNPIYLGDTLILLGAAFWMDTLLGLAVVAGFVWIVQDRFITVEEERLAETFGDPAAEWFVRVRRWI